MTILQNIENDSINALRNKLTVPRAILSTLIGEIKMAAKNDGNREVTDEDCIRITRKFIKNVEDNIVQLEKLDRDTGAPNIELQILLNYLPKEVTEEDIRAWAIELINGTYEPVARTIKVMGPMMSMLKQHFGASLNPAVASKIVKEILSA